MYVYDNIMDISVSDGFRYTYVYFDFEEAKATDLHMKMIGCIEYNISLLLLS